MKIFLAQITTNQSYINKTREDACLFEYYYVNLHHKIKKNGYNYKKIIC